MDWMIPCQKAATLLVAREDRPLALGERGALRFHLLICKACTRFEHQMLTMRQAMDGWRNYTEQSLDGSNYIILNHYLVIILVVENNMGYIQI